MRPLVLRWRGDWAKSRREAAGLSVTEAAAASGVVEATMRHYESGREPRHTKTIQLMARAYGCKTEEFFEFKEDEA